MRKNIRIYTIPNESTISRYLPTRVDLLFTVQYFIDNEQITSGTFLDTQITGIYAPSGTSNTAQRTNFFHSDVAMVLQIDTKFLLVGVIGTRFCTGMI